MLRQVSLFARFPFSRAVLMKQTTKTLATLTGQRSPTFARSVVVHPYPGSNNTRGVRPSWPGRWRHRDFGNYSRGNIQHCSLMWQPHRTAWCDSHIEQPDVTATSNRPCGQNRYKHSSRWYVELLLVYMFKHLKPSLKSNSFPFCPHSVFMCFVWIWEQTAIISLYSINWLFFTTEI
jgi:hypothetical protein